MRIDFTEKLFQNKKFKIEKTYLFLPDFVIQCRSVVYHRRPTRDIKVEKKMHLNCTAIQPGPGPSGRLPLLEGRTRFSKLAGLVVHPWVGVGIGHWEQLMFAAPMCAPGLGHLCKAGSDSCIGPRTYVRTPVWFCDIQPRVLNHDDAYLRYQTGRIKIANGNGWGAGLLHVVLAFWLVVCLDKNV